MPDEIEAALVLHRASADAHQRAVGERDLQAEHVISRDAVLQAARSAGVGGDVAAERAFLQAGRIGRIEQAVLAGLRLEFAGDHAGLYDANAVDGIDLEDRGSSARRRRRCRASSGRIRRHNRGPRRAR